MFLDREGGVLEGFLGVDLRCGRLTVSYVCFGLETAKDLGVRDSGVVSGAR